MLSCLLHSGRLVARTPAFQVGEAGSKPVRSTSQLGAVVGYGFALQAYCLEGFDTLGLHQICLVIRVKKARIIRKARFNVSSILSVRVRPG